MSTIEVPTTTLTELAASLRTRLEEINQELSRYDELLVERSRIEQAIEALEPTRRRPGRPRKNTE